MAPANELPLTGWRRLRTYRFPVLMLPLVVAMVAFAGVNQLVAAIPVLALLVGVGLAIAGVLGYRWLVKTVELRPEIVELAKQRKWSGLGGGALLGFGLFTALMLLIAMFGGWQDLSWGSFGGFVAAIGAMASVAVMEEVAFRGVLFRVLEQRAGTVISLVLSAVLFGAIHLFNTNATLWGALSIGLTGGTMLASAYVVTRSLWLPIGLHFGWNFTHSGVFGAVLSGSDTAPHGLLDITLSGPSALTGGTFGPEASLLALLVCLVPTVVFLRRAARTGRIQSRPRPVQAGS
ncbi:MAG: type II CAAX endopeptidase family protein [Kibdelosporangium sp.]